MSINKRNKNSGINRLNTRFKKIKKVENKKNTKGIIKIIIYVILFFIIIGFLFLIVLYNKYIKPLDIEDLKNLQIAESSVLYDKNGKQMHKFYKEKRTYVDYEHISKNIINGLVAGEDQRYWENPGVDIIGLLRAGIRSVTGGDRIAGTSTLTQQLIRNTIISKKKNESFSEGVDRKIKEIFLSYQLTKSLTKEKIIELYLNKIEFGHNAFGIEEASKTFFNKSAKDINVFQGAILASLPKGPTYFSPYNYRDRLIGYFNLDENEVSEITGKNEIKKLISPEEIESQNELVEKFKEKVRALKGKGIDGSDKYVVCNVDKDSLLTKDFPVDSKGCVVLEYSRLLNFISDIKVNSGKRVLTYYPGRKDYILQRMLEDNYITFEEYKNAFLEGIAYKFNTKKDSILAPHFVFYVKEYLEEKYGEENISMGGLKIYTTLDLDLQKQAEELVKKQIAQASQKYNVKSSGLVTIDNKTGGILTMVGNVDYYSDDGKGQVNVMTSKLQPGSSFKPFVYSLAMYENEIGPKTPVYDVKTDFGGGYSPKNFDGRFMGKMTISSALNSSRNIPAIKMFYLTSGVDDIIKFMNKLGATSLTKEENYGASLALGTGRMTGLDLAKAYTVFANMGQKVNVNPILKIVDSKGNVIEDNSNPKKEQVITSGQAFLLNSILSDSSTRPGDWNRFLDIGRTFAAKTGTSTKPVTKKGKTTQYPANLWTAGYTPQYTTVVWSGNADGETLNFNASGLMVSGIIWKDFMKTLHKGKPVEDWKKPSDVKSVKISELSGLLPSPNFPNNFLVSSYFINSPKKFDDSYKEIQYDALCNGKVTSQTPESAIKTKIIVNLHSLKPDKLSWENPVQQWIKSSGILEKYGFTGDSNVQITDEVCNRSGEGGNINIKTTLSTEKTYAIGGNNLGIAYKSDLNILKIEILINGEVIQSIPVNNSFGTLEQNFIIPEKFKNSKVKVEIRAINSEYFTSSETKTIKVGEKGKQNIEEVPESTSSGNTETEKPENDKKSKMEIKITNPKNSSIKIDLKDYFNLRFSVSKENLLNVNILIDGELLEKLGNEGNYVVPVNLNQKLKKGINNLKIQAVSTNGEIAEKMVQIDIL